MFGTTDTAIAAALGSLSAEPDVILTAADMDDPELAAELAAVLGESSTNPQSRPANRAPPPDHGAGWDAALKQQIDAKKKLAIQLKATDKKAAMQALREAKSGPPLDSFTLLHPKVPVMPLFAAQIGGVHSKPNFKK